MTQTSATIPADIIEQLNRNNHSPEDALPFENLNDLLNPGVLPKENGHCRMPDGSFFVAVLTPMPDVTSEMIDWWFEWHPLASDRYQMWFPGSHSGISFERLQEPSPNEPGYWHTIHYPVEDIGIGEEKVKIHFVPPAEFGFDTARFETANIETIICGYVGSVSRKLKEHTRMCHLVRRTENGLEIRSRFWMGGKVELNPFPGSKLIDRFLNTKQFRKMALQNRTGKSMAMHCAHEYNNLRELLPGLYRENH